MGLEVTDEQENTGNGNPVSMEQLEALQKEIEKLKKQGPAPAPATDNELMSLLVDKLVARDEPARTGQFQFDRQYTEADIDPDDLLTESERVTFVAHKVGYVIADDKRNGRAVQAPFDVIVFKYNSTKQVKNGRETDLINLCTYTCSSKKELEWLRNHSLFRITFFDKISTAMSSDVDRAQRLAGHMMRLQNIGQHRLVEMAKQRDIEPGDMDLNAIRAMIAHSVVEEEMKANANASVRALEQSQLESDLIDRSLN
jgi:hypothetical protein